ncbi:MAG: Zn-dependent alcohol dehydrogenase [Chloroflexota bacterium]
MVQTKAAVLYEPGKSGFEVEQLEVLEPLDGEVLIKYVAAGVCHSDLHYVQGKVFHPIPAVLGHEGAGIVEAVGPNVTDVKVGDHVLTSYIPSCGKCKWCTIGRPRMCDLTLKPRHLMHDGTSRFRKGDQVIYHMNQLSTFSERAVVPQVSLVPIRKDAPLEVICLVSCGVMTGAGAVMNKAKIEPGSTVAVWGCGGIGLNAIQMASIMGAAKVIAVDVVDQKLEWSRDFGATHLVNGAKEDVVERIRQICGNEGCDYAIEAVGLQVSMEQAFNAIHRGGMAIMIGMVPQGTKLTVDPYMLLGERVLTGTGFGSTRQRVDLPMIVDMFMDGKYKLRELISQFVELEDINRAYEQLEAGSVRRSVIRYQ